MTGAREFTVYDPATGEIAYSVMLPEGREPDPAKLGGAAVVNGRHDGETHWINPQTGRANQRRAVTAKALQNAVTGIPEGAWARVNGQPVDVVDGAVSIGVDWPETVTVEIGGPRLNRTVLFVDCVPSEAKADAAIAVAQDVIALRRQAYPDVGDQLDAIWKALDAMAAALPAEVATVRAAVADVKRTFPKS